MGFFNDIFSTSKRIIEGGRDVLKEQLGSKITYERGSGITSDTGPLPQAVGSTRKLLLGERPQERLDRLQTEAQQSFTPSRAYEAVAADIRREGGAVLPSQTRSGVEDIQTIDPFGLVGATSRAKSKVSSAIQKRGRGIVMETGKKFEKRPIMQVSTDELLGRDITGFSDLDPKRVDFYKRKLTKGEKVDPLKLNESKGDIFTEDGKHRLAAMRELGIDFADAVDVTDTIKTDRLVSGKNVKPIDRLIAENKVRVQLIDGKDTYQIKKGNVWKTVRDEDSAIKQLTPKDKLPKTIKETTPEIDGRLTQAEIAKEALDADPMNQLVKFTSKTGQNKGVLPEVTGGAKGKFAGRGDDIASELGFDDTETARAAMESFLERKTAVNAELKAAKLAVKDFKPAPKKLSAEGIPLSTKSIEARIAKKPAQVKQVPTEQVRSLEEAARKTSHDIRPIPVKQQTAKIDPLEGIVTRTPLENKINVLDYMRTPDRVLNKIGMGKEAAFLRKQQDKYSVALPENLDKITKWVKQVPKESNVKLFNYLDGKDVKLTPTEQKVAGEIKEYLAEWADKLGLPEDQRVTNYITHLFDDQLIAKEFDEDLAKIIGDKIPGEVYNPFLQKRLGAKGYKQDVWGALDAYTKRATRKEHIDPALEKIKTVTGDQLEFSRLEDSQFKYMKRYIDRVQMRPTELDNIIDNAVKQVAGYKFGQRPITQATRTLRNLTYKGMLGGNIGSALRNLSQGINTYATLGEKHTAIGYSKLFSPSARKEIADSGILASNFIEDRTLSATKNTIKKFDKALWAFFDGAEKINRGAAYLGAKSKGLAKGMSEEEAIDFGKSVVRKTQFAYDAVDAPVAFGSDIMKTLFQFQTFTTKQTEFLVELAKDKNFVGLARYAAAGYLFVNTAGKALGMEEKELLPVYRFDTPPSLKLPAEIGRAIVDAPDQYGNDRDLSRKLKDIGKASLGIIPGGIQARKTVQGIEAVEEGGSFDKGGRKQFDVGETAAQKLQAVLFGKYAGPGAKEYFDKKVDTGEKELDKAVKEAKEASAERNKEADTIFKDLNKLPKDEANVQLKAIYDTDRQLYDKIKSKIDEDKLGLTEIDKGIKKLGVTDGTRAAYIYSQYQKIDDPAEARAYLADLRTKKVISDAVLKQLKELKSNAIIN